MNPASARSRTARLWCGIALAAVALAGCADSSRAAGGSAAEDSAAEGKQGEASAAEIPDTAIGEKTRWVLDVLNAAEDTTAEEWEAALHPNFLEEVPASEFADVINREVRPGAPFAVAEYEAGETQSVTSIDGSSSFDMQLTIDDEGWIVGIFFASRSAA